MRGDQLSRVWRLVQLLSGGNGRTLAQLHAELGVTKRTVQRDIAALEQAGFPIESHTRNGTVRWRFLEGFRAGSSVVFTMPELMALYFSRGLLRPLQGTPLYEAIESALGKVGAAIPAQGHVLLQGFDRSIAVSNFGWKDYSQSKETIASITKAVHHGFTLRVTHATVRHKSAVTRLVDPYKLWYANGGLYLVGLDHDKQDVRVFAVDRIRSVEVTKRRFEILKGFEFEEYQKAAFQIIGGEPQLIRIRFSPEQAPYVVERIWHESQKLKAQPDGSVILSLSVASLFEVKRWLLGWGADAEVLEPQALRESCSVEFRSIFAKDEQDSL
jgi:predicted DNA-binding transcriptional regulator YafY